MIKEAQLGLDFNPTDSFVVSIFERNGFIFDNRYRLESVSGGLVHHMYRLVSAEKTMYLKIRGSIFSNLPDIQVDPNDIQFEKQAMNLLDQKLPGMFPHVLAYYANDHALLMTDVIPSGLTLERLFNSGTVSEEIMHACGKAVAKFHKAVEFSPPIRPDNDDITYSNNLLYRLGYLRIHEIDRVIERLKQMPRQVIFCDFSPKNIGVNANDEVTFCDLELVHFGNTIFDINFLASHILLHSKSVEEGSRRLTSFLAGYLSEVNTDLNEELSKVLILGIGLFRLDNPIIPYFLPINEKVKEKRILKIREILSNDVKPWSQIIEGMTYA
ncbi:MAG: hypothetical protein UT33_C0002G0002 [Candidatus Peregrinibacteria bacterium GW2011_GWC2_39_14]|nr:MAG: hypothetical protein UT33_C0002G0002 [Candidatus Peregrinibacteria bacterium GW2011_GWC2_39_14]